MSLRSNFNKNYLSYDDFNFIIIRYLIYKKTVNFDNLKKIVYVKLKLLFYQRD